MCGGGVVCVGGRSGCMGVEVNVWRYGGGCVEWGDMWKYCGRCVEVWDGYVGV